MSDSTEQVFGEGQPAVPGRAVVSSAASAANNTGTRGAALPWLPDPVVPPGGRRAARCARRQARPDTPVLPDRYEMRARHEDGRCCEHYGDRKAVERVAAKLRAEGWRVTWFPIVCAPAASWQR